ncbi:hypothetical protein BDQ17DRAFT_1367954 [Cyathus striatus]|nr:hypothetical protein BDQ17DRAFT_1367954 [Cyathus striatus]
MSVAVARSPHASQIASQPEPYVAEKVAQELVQQAESSSLRNPHDIPSFNSSDFVNPECPVLYLPPLLSSLPERLPPLQIVSPYPPLTTETRLPDIDPASLSLHKALHLFKPITEDYAGVPYQDAFNWSELTLPTDEERDWYCVVFRSKRKAGSDGGALYEADKLAHEEAIQNGGVSRLV